MKKRLFSILLALCMVLCLVPTTAFAEDSTEETPVCTCEIACTEETMNTECPVCGAEGALAENCGKYVEPAAEGEASQPEGEKTQKKQDSDMPDTQSEAALAQMSGEGENGIAVQSAGVAIDNTNFPDANFRTVVKEYDTDKDENLSRAEIEAVKEIKCYYKDIRSLTGIEYFTALQTLKCYSNLLTSLDISGNTALKSLDCAKNQLAALDVSQNTALESLDCAYNQLTTLDVSRNTALESLDCANNQLTTLDVSRNTALESLNCADNQLTALDISQNTALESLICAGNKLTALNVSGNATLKSLDCAKNQLAALDVSQNTALESLDCAYNQLTSLNVSLNLNLQDLNCYTNQLSALDVQKNTALKSLYCGHNQLTVLDVGQNRSLESLDCDNNLLTSLDVSQNTTLYLLLCFNNHLTSLDTSNQKRLHTLSCNNNNYPITITNDRNYDLSDLPGAFDISKASNWKGGTVSGSTLTVDNDKDTVTYTYDCGNGRTANFTLKCTQVAQGLGVYVNGEQFTSEKLSISCGEGIASYDPDTKTLTLNNATITNGGKSDENPKYGIRVIGDTDLTIKLSGTNSITLDNGGGIFADGNSNNYNIIGDGKLSIAVKWDALYTLNGNISISEGAELDIKSAEGNGIMSYNKGNISINGAKVKSFAYYSAANAKELEVKNGSEVVLNSSEDYFNAAYMGDGNGVGKIEIINSNVEATSYYPALYTEGKLTVNGGEVKCTSTADAAIWTKGDILIKGGAKVTTDGKYPMGGYCTFTVEEAEVDAKNTNTNNIPAIFDECVPVIADGYQLTYAKAVDSEGTAIDLLSSGTQYFALYKNVHFITKAVYPVSFDVTPDGLTNVLIKVNGQVVTNPVNLVAGTYQIEITADNCKAYSGNITVTADAATHTQTIAMTYLPADYTKVDKAIDKANELNKDNYKDISAVEAAVKAVVRDKNITEQTEVDAMAKAIEDAITALQYKGADYTKVDEAIAKANTLKKDDYKDFSGVEAAVNAVVRGKNITEQSEVDKMAKAIEDAIAALEKKPASTKPGTSDKSPKTGDISNLALWIVLLFVSGGAAIGTTVVSRKKKYNK